MDPGLESALSEDFRFEDAPQIPAATIRELFGLGFVERAEPALREARDDRSLSRVVARYELPPSDRTPWTSR